jgi:hypothetical protein
MDSSARFGSIYDDGKPSVGIGAEHIGYDVRAVPHRDVHALSSLSAWYTAVGELVSVGIFSTPSLVVRLLKRNCWNFREAFFVRL